MTTSKFNLGCCMCKLLYWSFVIYVAVLILSGCSTINYKALPDGTTNITITSLWDISSINGASMLLKTPTVERNFSLSSANSDTVKGLDDVPGIAEGIATGVVRAMKP